MPKNVGGSEKYVGKGSSDAVLGVGTNVGGSVGKASPDAVFSDAIHDIGKASPDRLYRATLLRNRFANTILKAREKALEKGDKWDPEKVRMEREELERQQREGWR
uniref:Uncharacterized protein n=1 Tax=Cucumis melo TaxID=3656 RepID=A0A9I9EM06_CUCME